VAETLGPGTLRALAARLSMPAMPAQVDALVAHADAWEAERVARAALAEELAEAQRRVELLERDKRWWQDNAIKRRKRAEQRRSRG
jgi:hypothetical protein